MRAATIDAECRPPAARPFLPRDLANERQTSKGQR